MTGSLKLRVWSDYGVRRDSGKLSSDVEGESDISSTPEAADLYWEYIGWCKQELRTFSIPSNTYSGGSRAGGFGSELIHH